MDNHNVPNLNDFRGEAMIKLVRVAHRIKHIGRKYIPRPVRKTREKVHSRSLDNVEKLLIASFNCHR